MLTPRKRKVKNLEENKSLKPIREVENSMKILSQKRKNSTPDKNSKPEKGKDQELDENMIPENDHIRTRLKSVLSEGRLVNSMEF